MMIFTLQKQKLPTILIVVILFCCFSVNSQYKQEMIAKGSYAINLGLTPQSSSNALKPYGLIYELLAEYPVEIKWVINPEKKKDGVDFVIDEHEFRSGSFVIPVSYISSAVKNEIESWEKRGVLDFI